MKPYSIALLLSCFPVALPLCARAAGEVPPQPPQEAGAPRPGNVQAVLNGDLQACLDFAKSPDSSKIIYRWLIESTIPKETLEQLGKNGFLSRFAGDQEWMEGFFNSGPVPNIGLALEKLAALYRRDPKIASHPLYRKLATATALEYARQSDKEMNNPKKKKDFHPSWTDERMFQTYDYYRTSHAKGLLNPVFDTLDYWDMRILTGRGPGDWTSPESLTWLRDNVRLPAQQYVGACWQAPYRLHNEFGESIHSGASYYAPFDGMFKGGRAEMTREVGAVCGGLSTYGATAAIANGVPALTMGEPGHCAYTVRPDKEWVPAYSLSWKRGCHWNFYGEKWSLLIATQNTFSDKAARDLSGKLVVLGDAARKAGHKDRAGELYRAALEVQPINFAHWQQYLDWCSREGGLGRNQWQEVSRQIVNAYGKDYPEIAWMLLSGKVYPVLIPLLETPQEKEAEIRHFHQSLDRMKPANWDFPGALAKQMDYLGGDEAAAGTMMKVLMDEHMKSQDYVAPSLVWCSELTAAYPSLKDQFYKSVASAGSDIGDKVLEQLASSIIMQAEKTGDIQSFQAAGSLLKDRFHPKLPRFDPFPGELLSSGGMLIPNSVHERYGPPWQHWGVLEACGGFFHTNNKEDATEVKVILPRMGELSGIVVVSRKSHVERGDGTVVEVSEDGSDWKEVGTIEKMQQVQRIDLGGKNVRAKYVRLKCNRKDYFHLDGILVYGRRLA